jgi:hypothetical protein
MPLHVRAEVGVEAARAERHFGGGADPAADPGDFLEAEVDDAGGLAAGVRGEAAGGGLQDSAGNQGVLEAERDARADVAQRAADGGKSLGSRRPAREPADCTADPVLHDLDRLELTLLVEREAGHRAPEHDPLPAAGAGLVEHLVLEVAPLVLCHPHPRPRREVVLVGQRGDLDRLLDRHPRRQGFRPVGFPIRAQQELRQVREPFLALGRLGVAGLGSQRQVLARLGVDRRCGGEREVLEGLGVDRRCGGEAEVLERLGVDRRCGGECEMLEGLGVDRRRGGHGRGLG